VITTVGMAIA